MSQERQGRQLPDEGVVDFDTEPSAGSQDGPGADSSATEAPAEAPPDQRVAELTADLQRLQAEYVNYKRRVDRDRDLVLQNAKFATLSALLPVLDAIDRARDHGELEGGFKAVAEALERVVEGQGLVKFGKPGDPFDPRHHEALTHGHSPDVAVPTCQHVVQAGYQIGERVVRPALVTVVDPESASGAPEEPQPVVDQPDAVVPDDVEPETDPGSQPDSDPDSQLGSGPGPQEHGDD